MAIPLEEQPLIVLADDDVHSARLLIRTLNQFGAHEVKWLGDGPRTQRVLAAALADELALHPCLVVVDLKQASSATADFVRAIHPLLPADIPVIALAPTLDREERQVLIDAGAAAVFQRHANLQAYQDEVAAMIGFLDRHRLDNCRRIGAIEPRRRDGRMSREFLTDLDVIDGPAELSRTASTDL
jgi:CheY-like chemotaxis protein